MISAHCRTSSRLIVIVCCISFISLTSNNLAYSQYDFSYQNIFYQRDLCLSNPKIPVIHDDLVPHVPIIIESDSDFITLGFPGNGTKEDPFRIENYTIITETGIGIDIESTEVYFRVQNCYVNAFSFGIHLINVAEGTASIINNTCSYNLIGIRVNINAPEILVANNTCCENGSGISIESPHAIIVGNICLNNKNRGISISESDYSIIENNTLDSNEKGMILDKSESSLVSNNEFNNNKNEGLTIQYSNASLIQNNQFLNDGLVIAYTLELRNEINYTIKNNFVNDKPIGFFVNEFDKKISENYGQIIMINCSEMIINNQYSLSSAIGVALLDCTKIQVLNSNITYNKISAIKMQWSSKIFIANNTISYNKIGILVDASHSYWVIYNTFRNNSGYAIQGSNTGYIHHNNFVNNNDLGSSQAYSSTPVTKWYDSTNLEGNYWSDWNGEGVYYVDGSDSNDLFPFSSLIVDIPDEFEIPWEQEETVTSNFLFGIMLLPLVIITLTQNYFRQKNRRKKQ